MKPHAQYLRELLAIVKVAGLSPITEKTILIEISAFVAGEAVSNTPSACVPELADELAEYLKCRLTDSSLGR